MCVGAVLLNIRRILGQFYRLSYTSYTSHLLPGRGLVNTGPYGLNRQQSYTFVAVPVP